MRAIRAIIGLVLLPFCVAITRTLFFIISSPDTFTHQAGHSPFIAVAGGFALWLATFIFLPKPTRIYVLGHELSHALWGALMGARISRIRVSKTGGYVKLSNYNAAVVLAPYFFPIYTFASILLYYIASIFFDMRWLHFGWLAWIGFTIGFHFTFTLRSLSEQQSDIREYGRIFSYSIIYLLCTLQITILIILLSSSTAMESFVCRIISDITETWAWCMEILRSSYKFIVKFI